MLIEFMIYVCLYLYKNYIIDEKVVIVIIEDQNEVFVFIVYIDFVDEFM